MIDILNEYPEAFVEVQGHTDDRGDDATNMTLSQGRAESVMEYLKGKGIDESRLTAKGYGETMPVATNKTRRGRNENRRVDFKLTY